MLNLESRLKDILNTRFSAEENQRLEQVEFEKGNEELSLQHQEKMVDKYQEMETLVDELLNDFELHLRQCGHSQQDVL